MRTRQSLLIGTALIGALAATQARAADEELLRELRAMRAEVQSLRGEVNHLKKELGEAKSAAAASKKVTDEIKAAKARPENDVKISMVPAPKFETADGAYSFKVGGFAQVDAGMFSDDVRDHPNGTTLRRARLNASGAIAKDFKYKIENDFANNVSALTDVYLEYTGFEPVSIMVGQFKEPFSLETLTSDLFTTFNERALPTAFSPDRKIGIAVSTYGKTEPIGAWTASIGYFGDGTGVASTDDEARDITGRLTLAPIAEKTRAVHLGVAGSRRVPDSAFVTGSGWDVYRVRSKPETSLTSSQAVDTGNITDVHHVHLLGLEAAGVYGPFAVQGEYMVSDVNRRNTLADQTFDGFYAEASYYLTGESKNYSAKSGKFDRVVPKWPFSLTQDQWGAWQVAARYSELDLNDSVIRGGHIRNTTYALRWIPNANTLVSLNYINANTDRSSTTARDDPDAWLLRTQFDF